MLYVVLFFHYLPMLVCSGTKLLSIGWGGDSLPVLIPFISLVNHKPPVCKLMSQDALSDKCDSADEGHWYVAFQYESGKQIKEGVFSLITLLHEYLIGPIRRPGFLWPMVS